MTIETKYDQNRKVLDVLVSGIPDLDELSSVLEKIINSGDYHPETKITSQFMVFRDYKEGEKWLLENE